ncbi:hypothetical protein MRB53_036562 [Persea americana]|nr:hypothetical protein MRB53_036562 [Persea americana]
MVGLNPYHVVALRRRFGRPLRSPEARFIDFGRLYPGGGKQWSAPTPTLLWRCDVGPVGARSVRAVCCLSRVQSARACCCVVCARCCDTSACVRAAVPCARAAASAVRVCCCVVRACCCACSACLLLRGCVGAAAASAVRGLSVRACCCLGRPPARFVVSGRLYPGGWKQWSASTPTMSWHCAVGSAGRYGRPRPVSSISDVYTQEVGNNGRHQPLHCCGVATSVRSVHVRACVLLCRACELLRLQCARSAASASARALLCRSRVLLRRQCARAAASSVRGCCCCVGRARSVRGCVLLSRSPPGPFCRIWTFIPRGLETMVGPNPYHVVALRRRFGRPLRSPKARFIDFGRLYPGGGKQWSAPTPTMLWRCPVGPRSLRAVCSLSRVQSARAP